MAFREQSEERRFFFSWHLSKLHYFVLKIMSLSRCRAWVPRSLEPDVPACRRALSLRRFLPRPKMVQIEKRQVAATPEVVRSPRYSSIPTSPRPAGAPGPASEFGSPSFRPTVISAPIPGPHHRGPATRETHTRDKNAAVPEEAPEEVRLLITQPKITSAA